MNPPYFLSDTKGNLRFTSQGLKELGPYLAMVGIDINTISTIAEYERARQAASPYFMAWLKIRYERWPDNEQFNLLKNALFEND